MGWVEIVLAIITALPKLITWIMELIGKVKPQSLTDAPAVAMSAEQKQEIVTKLADAGIQALTELKAKFEPKAVEAPLV